MSMTDNCIRCGNEPRMPARLIGNECHKTNARERHRRMAARRRLDRQNPDACNCNDPACTGVTCDFVRVA